MSLKIEQKTCLHFCNEYNFPWKGKGKIQTSNRLKVQTNLAFQGWLLLNPLKVSRSYQKAQDLIQKHKLPNGFCDTDPMNNQLNYDKIGNNSLQ